MSLKFLMNLTIKKEGVLNTFEERLSQRIERKVDYY